MVESVTAQPEDVRLIRALQIAPRASFASIAAALGVTESALGRRYRRLRAAGVIRVAGVVNPGALGQSRWLVRLRCRPGSVAAIADALAKRPDVSWVALCAAGSEITCAVRSRTQEQRDDLLGHRLPRTAAVLDLNAFAMLRQFVGGRGHYWVALRGTLTPEEEAALGSDGTPFKEAPVVAADPVQLTPEDEKMLDVLAADGRAGLVDLAAAADLTPGRAARRLELLLARGVVHIDVELSAVALGLHARANLWLRVHPSAVKSVGRALAQEPEIGFAAAVSGPYNLHAVAVCRNLDELFEFTSDRIGSLPGLQSMEVSPLLRHVKQSGTLVSGDRLVGV
ncbi:DNA-binding Lrp family transcriptional regulator [Amycolatopsis bartoniae]|uniref:Transcriptional regulator n=1 Tax=Amycolatopsis bartoniae TaxID=941986 RepID=A0A8H9MDC7_9PSEU|nr:Lrp/AsnC family transcriptional regulator [Amycolatopsis bartoniae]MBB2935730.1 DNA-binding Lrp family transcriptional regulator [Amycolatopsis bartoniae]TVT05837.1 Lrp/AsnC family transcriptional regulator [Amycolatopsis bartoniae]GHF61471.1 transcriptional regulator [Amycolatopsis bartoniae]